MTDKQLEAMMQGQQVYGLWYDGLCGGWVLQSLDLGPIAWQGSKAEAERTAERMVANGDDRPLVKPFSKPWRVMPFGQRCR